MTIHKYNFELDLVVVQKLVFLYLSWTKKCKFISKCKKKELIKACAFFSGEARNENVGDVAGGGGGQFLFWME